MLRFYIFLNGLNAISWSHDRW